MQKLKTYLRLTLAFFLFQTSTFLQATNCEKESCVAIVDVGSTGSRLHIYSYELDKNKFPTKIEEIFTKSVTPGLASIGTSKQALMPYLEKLLDYPEETNKNIPLYFYATAGMRLLPNDQQDKIYSNVEAWFNTQSNWKLQQTKTITGKEEGIYGWLALNYRLNTLKVGKDTVGVLDLGGASTQITFPVKDTNLIHEEDLVEINLYGHSIKVFSHSFLGLGANEVIHQFLNTSSCFITNYQLPNALKAQGDGYKCKDKITLLINGLHQLNEKIPPILKKNPVKAWYVLGGINYLAQATPFSSTKPIFNLKKALDTGNSIFCHGLWPGIASTYSHNPYLYAYCILPAYYYSLIVEGYEFNQETPLHIFNSSKGDLGWSLGAVLMLPH